MTPPRPRSLRDLPWIFDDPHDGGTFTTLEPTPIEEFGPELECPHGRLPNERCTRCPQQQRDLIEDVHPYPGYRAVAAAEQARQR